MDETLSGAELYVRAYLTAGHGPGWTFSEKDLRRLKAHLKLNFPVDLDVRFRRVLIPEGQMGDCSLVVPKSGKDAYFLIRIDKRLPLVAQWLVTIHEYAHAMQWRPPIQESQRLADHDGEWGLCEARLWEELGG